VAVGATSRSRACPGSLGAGRAEAGPRLLAARDERALPGGGGGLDLSDGRPVADATAPRLVAADVRGLLAPVPALSRPDRVLLVRAPGRATVLVPDTAGPLVLVLPRAQAIDGTVRREDGGVPKDAIVLAWPAGTGRGLVHRALPDAEGRYAFGAVGPGRWRIEARRPGGVRQGSGPSSAATTCLPRCCARAAASKAGSSTPTSGARHAHDGRARTPRRQRRARHRGGPAPKHRHGPGEPGAATGPVASVRDRALTWPPLPPRARLPPGGPMPAPAPDDLGSAPRPAPTALAFVDVRRASTRCCSPDPLLAWDGPPPSRGRRGRERAPALVVAAATRHGRRHGPRRDVARTARGRCDPGRPGPRRPLLPGPSHPRRPRHHGRGRRSVRGVAPGAGYRVVATAAGRSAVVLGPSRCPRRVTDADVLLWRDGARPSRWWGPTGSRSPRPRSS
jgi:hypothetical protein